MKRNEPEMKRNVFVIQSRRDSIRARIKETGSVSVYEMSRIFDVSESTIRRDLEAIEDKGVIRFHGGMKVNERESVFEEKNVLSADLKDAIAARAAEMIQDGQTIFLNAGTTTLALFRRIKDRDICIVTNNVVTVTEPGPFRAELILVGGHFRARSRSLVGGMAGITLSQAYADLCFLGTNGVSPERGLTTILHQESEVNRIMGERSRKVVCIADSSKLGIDAGFVSLPLDRVSALITDHGADRAVLDKLKRGGVDILLSNGRNRG